MEPLIECRAISKDHPWYSVITVARHYPDKPYCANCKHFKPDAPEVHRGGSCERPTREKDWGGIPCIYRVNAVHSCDTFEPKEAV